MIPDGDRRGQSLLVNIISAALDGEEDEAAQKGVRDEESADAEVYNEPFEEGLTTAFIRRGPEAEAPHLRGLGL